MSPPASSGLNSTELFREGMDKLLGGRTAPCAAGCWMCPPTNANAPQFSGRLISSGRPSEADSPIAFLNLDRGALPGLGSWHWVSLIAMDHEGDKLTATAADNGQLLGLDIGLWLETTKRSGGFVYLGNDFKLQSLMHFYG